MTLQIFGGTEGADYSGGVVLVGVNFGVHVAHVGDGDFSGKVGEGCAKRRKFRERVFANDRYGVVGREIVTIVGEADEMERIDEAVGGIAGDDVDLFVDERAVDEAEIHDARGRGELKAVALDEAAIAVGAFEEFVADTSAPARGDRNDVGNCLEMELLGVRAANDHRKRVFESERLGNIEVKLLGVASFDALINGARVGVVGGQFVEDSGQRGTGVFDVEVEITREECFLAEERAAEIRFSVYVNAGASFDVLREEFGEDDLLGEKFGADGNVRLRWSARNETGAEGKKQEENAPHGWQCLMN